MKEWVGEDRRTRRKTFLRSRVSACIGLGLNLDRCNGSLAHNHLNNGTAVIKVIGVLILGTGILSCFVFEVSPTVFTAIIDNVVCLSTELLQSI